MNTDKRADSSRKLRRGFTLAELMVVIVILGLLATVVVPKVWTYFTTANRAVAKMEISNICQALDNYALNNGGQFPETLGRLTEPDGNGNTYLDADETPVDPWGSEYLYEPPLIGTNDYKVITYGKDGQPGGTGENEDLDNRSIKRRNRR